MKKILICFLLMSPISLLSRSVAGEIKWRRANGITCNIDFTIDGEKIHITDAVYCKWGRHKVIVWHMDGTNEHFDGLLGHIKTDCSDQKY